MESQKDINMEIFDAVSKLLFKEEFTQAQHAYFNKHKDSITDDEENKLEYTQIHEGYVEILEMIIQTELQQTYSEEQVDAFYADLMADIKKYEDNNALCVN